MKNELKKHLDRVNYSGTEFHLNSSRKESSTPGGIKSQGVLFGLGNLLLDIVTSVSEDFLKKYGLEPDSIRLADDRLIPLFDEIQGAALVDQAPGGCALNTIRVALWILRFPKATTFVGAVGDDEDASRLLQLLDTEGVDLSECQRIQNTVTGRCAVLTTGNQRTLVTQLGAALKFNYEEFIQSKTYNLAMNKAEVFYISGYFLRVCSQTVNHVIRFAASKGRPVVLNLNAIWVVNSFSKELGEILPYVDYLIANISEMRGLAKENSCPYSEIDEIARWASNIQKRNSRRPRMVIITKSDEPLITAIGDSLMKIPVIPVPPKLLVDTNGAGDAFAGGFIAGLVRGKSHETCIRCGLWAASEIIQHRGCNFTNERTFPGD